MMKRIPICFGLGLLLSVPGTVSAQGSEVREVSFSGRTGDIACDERGDCGHALIVIYVIKGNTSSEAARYTP